MKQKTKMVWGKKKEKEKERKRKKKKVKNDERCNLVIHTPKNTNQEKRKVIEKD